MSKNESNYSLLQELEAAQARHVNGGIDPVPEKWIPVQRVKMSDAEVDALVEGAEAELGVPKLTATQEMINSFIDKTGEAIVLSVGKGVGKSKLNMERKVLKKATSKKVKKIDRAREIYKANKKADRKDVLKMFVKQIKLSPQAASTYYQICKHG